MILPFTPTFPSNPLTSILKRKNEGEPRPPKRIEDNGVSFDASLDTHRKTASCWDFRVTQIALDLDKGPLRVKWDDKLQIHPIEKISTAQSNINKAVHTLKQALIEKEENEDPQVDYLIVPRIISEYINGSRENHSLPFYDEVEAKLTSEEMLEWKSIITKYSHENDIQAEMSRFIELYKKTISSHYTRTFDLYFRPPVVPKEPFPFTEDEIDIISKIIENFENSGPFVLNRQFVGFYQKIQKYNSEKK